jgi:hypothetical protein
MMQPIKLTPKNALNFIAPAIISAGIVFWLQKFLEYKAFEKVGDKVNADKAMFLLKLTPAMIAIGGIAWVAGSALRED